MCLEDGAWLVSSGRVLDFVWGIVSSCMLCLEEFGRVLDFVWGIVSSCVLCLEEFGGRVLDFVWGIVSSCVWRSWGIASPRIAMVRMGVTGVGETQSVLLGEYERTVCLEVLTKSGVVCPSCQRHVFAILVVSWIFRNTCWFKVVRRT